MANTIPSPLMNLPIPVVGNDPGPDYAANINACLLTIDGHNHTSGYGSAIPSAGLNINADLSFGSNNATLLRSARFSPQGSPLAGTADLGCLYESGVDLYYNDGSGNQVRITQSGGVAGSPGSIANLSSPASASYVSANSTFVWQSAANTPATLDGGSLILRNITASSKGITLSPPNALAANYSLVLPAALPGAQSFLTVDNSGNIASPTAFANGITRANLAAVGQQVSSSCGSFVVPNTSGYVDITNLSVTITTTGRPVMILLIDDGSGGSSDISFGGTVANSQMQGLCVFNLLRGSTSIANPEYSIEMGSAGNATFALWAFSIAGVIAVDTPTAGTYSYKLQAGQTSGAFHCSVGISNYKLFVYEL